MNARDIELSARDGFRLAATLYEPSENNGITVLIGSATTVPRGFYRKFASFLCGRGCVVMTYDSREIGESVCESWKGRRASFRVWAEEDMAGAIDWLANQYTDNKLVCVGHSASGALFGLVPNNERVSAMVGVASPYAYWRDWGMGNPGNRLRMWMLSHVLFPLVTPIFNHYPGWFFGSAKWPPGVALEWARWARNPAFFVDDEGQPLREFFRKYKGKMRFYSFSDDLMIAPPQSVAKVASLFEQADVEVTHREPKYYAVNAVGHAGFFRSAMRDSAWAEVADWFGAGAPPGA